MQFCLHFNAMKYIHQQRAHLKKVLTEPLQWQICCIITRQCFITEGELWQVNESLTVAVGSVVCQGLHHVVSLQSSLLHSLLHQFDSLHTGHGVKVAVDSHNLGACSKMRHEQCVSAWDYPNTNCGLQLW